jgi:hypothetical protein
MFLPSQHLDRAKWTEGLLPGIGEIMKIGMLVVVIVGLSLTWSTWADDLAQLGHSPGIPVKDLVAKGYRWVAVDGPYACTTEQEVQQITSDHSDLRELHMVENLRAYYLIPGAVARVIQDDHANGMSEILLAGIPTPLWTYTKFLTARPIRDTYGVIETPNNAGLVDPRDAAIVGETGGKALNERTQASTP